MTSKNFQVRSVVFRQEEWWVAQCLEYDLVATARRLSELRFELDRLLIGHVVVAQERGTIPFAGLPPAAKRYWDLFASAADRIEPVDARATSLALSLGMSPPVIETRLAA